ncbi:MAG TPA: copper homeostasis protein CutC [Bacteroidota bacterium]|nr:copper homeostasis protein CutC [Bacteroidota bacterium]
MLLEVCVDSVESAVAAQAGGAGRIELCANLNAGGTTPDDALIREVRKVLSIPVHVMIRPRGGDFCYSGSEFEQMRAAIERVRTLGANGVVFGILDESGAIDIERARLITRLARPMSVTFHRAFDECSDFIHGIDDLKEVGVDRVLTSGGRTPIAANVELLRQLVDRSRGAFSIMAGGGVTFENVSGLVTATRVEEIHTLSAVLTDGTHLVDKVKVKKMVDLLQSSSLQSHS